MDLVLQNQYDSMDDSDLFPNRYRGWFQSGVYRQLMLFVFGVHLVFCAGSNKINFAFHKLGILVVKCCQLNVNFLRSLTVSQWLLKNKRNTLPWDTVQAKILITDMQSEG